jgi:hypothetical protein
MDVYDAGHEGWNFIFPVLGGTGKLDCKRGMSCASKDLGPSEFKIHCNCALHNPAAYVMQGHANHSKM